MLNRIFIKGLQIFAFHGVNPAEKHDGQNFILDLTLWVDTTRAQLSDDLQDTVNYAAVRKTVSAAMTEQSYDLIERAARVVAERVLAEHPAVQKIEVLLKKPEAPMNAIFDYVATEVVLCR
jgi:dihydroneopterin aldolase